jgi:hypothetical protein
LFTITLKALSSALDSVSGSENSKKESKDHGCFNSIRRLTFWLLGELGDFLLVVVVYLSGSLQVELTGF